VLSTSRKAAACGEVTMPMRRGKGGSARLRSLAKRPSAVSLSFVERADAGAPGGFDVELKVPARLVKRDENARFEMLPVRQSPAEKLGAVAEHHATDLRRAVLE
jgi:hypothetical protein